MANMKSNQQVGVDIAADFSAVTFTVKGFAPRTLIMANLSEAVRTRAACVGMAQVRVVDAAAIPAADKDGNIIPEATRLAMKDERIGALIDHYMTGTEEWSRVTAAKSDGGLLFEALCRLYGHMKAPSEIRAWLDGLSDKEQAALREDDEVAPVILRVKAERNAGKPKADTKALLQGLTAAPTQS